jgi:uncharacterized protein YkwD
MSRSIPLGMVGMVLFAGSLVLILSGCQLQQSLAAMLASSTPTVTMTFTPTSTATATATLTPTATATFTLTLTATVTDTPTATATFTPVPTRKPTIVSSGQSSSSNECNGTNSSVEANVRALINQQRTNAGLSTLANNSALANAARKHSQDMAVNNYSSHYGSSDPQSRIQAAGYSSSQIGKILFGATGTLNSPYSAVSSWMNSSVHREVMLTAAFTDMGVGYWCTTSGTYNGYYTVDFGKR